MSLWFFEVGSWGEREKKEGVIELNCFDLCSVIIKTKKFNESDVHVCECACVHSLVLQNEV